MKVVKTGASLSFVTTIRIVSQAPTTGTPPAILREALVDTGCSPGIVIPYSLAESLALIAVSARRIYLADGTPLRLGVCEANALIENKIQIDRVYVLPEADMTTLTPEARREFYTALEEAGTPNAISSIVVGMEALQNRLLVLDMREEGGSGHILQPTTRTRMLLRFLLKIC